MEGIIEGGEGKKGKKGRGLEAGGRSRGCRWRLWVDLDMSGEGRGKVEQGGVLGGITAV